MSVENLQLTKPSEQRVDETKDEQQTSDCFVAGPFLINACPLRRIHQRYVIGTQTKIDLSGAKLPENINDQYFRRERKKRAKKEEGDIFQTKKEVCNLAAMQCGSLLILCVRGTK